MRFRLAIALAIGVVLALGLPSVAFAFDENTPFPSTGCGGTCHAASAPTYSEANCGGCHEWDDTQPVGSRFPLTGEFSQSGPHGIYKTTTNRCSMCHTLHDAPTAFKLLPGATIKATCYTCHDGTQGYGVYGTIQARTGSPAPGGHGVEITNSVPGGSASDGGSAIMAFRGPDGFLTCSDCHSPHDSNTVAPFTGERLRLRAQEEPIYSTKLLKKRPTGATVDIDYYGSDWCAGCHQGRTSGGAVHNHPVETRATRPADFYYYSRLAVYEVPGSSWALYESGAPVPLTNTNARIGSVGGIMISGLTGVRHPATSTPVLHEVDWHKSPWLMAYPRSPLHAGHSPICQQCHEDTRECGELSADGATVSVIREAAWGPDVDGLPQSGTFVSNPKFQNFPHETQDPYMLVETGDDLCLNCHPTGVLP